jgi:release factor H-coupled RctB family protein
MIELSNHDPVLRVFASDGSWIEGDALQQLRTAANLDGVKAAVGLPDLHPGKGIPVGAAFLIQGMIYPYLIGNDVGCGMGVWQTSLKVRKAKRDKWAKQLKHLELPWEGDLSQWLSEQGLPASFDDIALGTIGGGNHFAELQSVERIESPEAFDSLKLDMKRFFLLVHSGSRGIGDGILRRHVDRFQAGGLTADTKEAREYIEAHDKANLWAKANRALIAERFTGQLGAKCQLVMDSCHNSLTRIDLDSEEMWLHRKGATASDTGPCVVPGSRGSLSYLVAPVGDQRNNLWSLAHGAGRKWNRKSCRGRIGAQFKAKALRQTAMGNVVICDDKQLLYEEAPQAYKNVDRVIQDMEDDGLIQVIATLRPLITYKVKDHK